MWTTGVISVILGQSTIVQLVKKLKYKEILQSVWWCNNEVTLTMYFIRNWKRKSYQ